MPCCDGPGSIGPVEGARRLQAAVQIDLRLGLIGLGLQPHRHMAVGLDPSQHLAGPQHHRRRHPG